MELDIKIETQKEVEDLKESLSELKNSNKNLDKDKTEHEFNAFSQEENAVIKIFLVKLEKAFTELRREREEQVQEFNALNQKENHSKLTIESLTYVFWKFSKS